MPVGQRKSRGSHTGNSRQKKRVPSRGRRSEADRVTDKRPDSPELPMQDQVGSEAADHPSGGRGRRRILGDGAEERLPGGSVISTQEGEVELPSLPCTNSSQISTESQHRSKPSHTTSRSAWVWAAGIVVMTAVAAVEVSGARAGWLKPSTSLESVPGPPKQSNDDLQRHGGAVPIREDGTLPEPSSTDENPGRFPAAGALADARGPPSLARSLPGLGEIWLVWCAAWLTAAATGLGALPFACGTELPGSLVAVSNASAAGMMLAASTSLVLEALAHAAEGAAGVAVGGSLGAEGSGPEAEGADDGTGLPGMADDLMEGAMAGLGDWRKVGQVLLGIALGVGFVLAASRWLAGHDGVTLADVGGMDAKRMLLLVAVMTAHSCTEGVSIGVSYASSSGEALFKFMSGILALHNVPEGLATALVLVPRGVAPVEAAVYAVGTSAPQPVFAVLGMLFVSAFRGLLPAGFGFAAGAMVWVALFDLAAEAAEAMGWVRTVGVTAVAGAGMMAVQMLMRGEE